jgi:hypothetical protein
MKVDIEGAELPALRGAADTIDRTRPHVICEFNSRTAEAFGYDPMEIVRFFSEEIRGYEVNVLTSRQVIRQAPQTRTHLYPPKIENWWFCPKNERRK